MRTSLAIVALVAIGGTAAGAGAATDSFLGSDTLFTVTTQAISGCSGASGLNYLGTGSGNGESGMISGAQAIAPMSRFLNNNICGAVTGTAHGTPATAEGIAIGLDGVAVAGSLSTSGQSACNGTPSSVCSADPHGLAFSTTVGGYTFANWKDVLAVLFGGKSHETAAQIRANSGANSGCASTLRATLANTWGNVFQTGSSCTSPDGCTELQHAFRRDDSSGTSDLFVSLLGLSPSPVGESNFSFGTSPFCNVNEASVASVTIDTTVTPNLVQVITGIAHHLTTGQTVQVVGVGVDINGNQIIGTTGSGTGPSAINQPWTVTVVDALTIDLQTSSATTLGQTGGTNNTKVGSYAMLLLPPPAGLLADYVATSYRDLDPVRRPCANNGSPTLNLEDVCDRDNQLGLVVPVIPTNFLTGGAAVQFPAPACAGGTNQAVKTAILVDPTTGLNVNANCPNGDTPHGGNLCPVPAAGGSNTACFSGPSDKPFVFNTKTGLTPAPGQVLGTVYNSRLMTTGKTFQPDVFNLPITGAWYRIHQLDAIAGSGASVSGGANVDGGNGGNPVTPASGTGICQQLDATLQIGCLVQASPCSVGFAGLASVAWNGASSANNVAIQVNQVSPFSQCVQSFDYAFSRKLYLDTIPGFGATTAAFGSGLSAPELGLAKCESTESAIGAILTANNFINYVQPGQSGFTAAQSAAFSKPNAGAPFAEDFNETMLCPTQFPPSTANTVAYSGNPSGTPAVGTICGNGVKENFEDCDDGTTGASGTNPLYGGNGGAASGSIPASNCSNTCRWIGNPPVIDPGTDTVATTANGTSTACGGTNSVAGDACTGTLNGTFTSGRCYQIGLALNWTCLP